jgi:hypothetical protein
VAALVGKAMGMEQTGLARCGGLMAQCKRLQVQRRHLRQVRNDMICLLVFNCRWLAWSLIRLLCFVHAACCMLCDALCHAWVYEVCALQLIWCTALLARCCVCRCCSAGAWRAPAGLRATPAGLCSLPSAAAVWGTTSLWSAATI